MIVEERKEKREVSKRGREGEREGKAHSFMASKCAFFGMISSICGSSPG